MHIGDIERLKKLREMEDVARQSQLKIWKNSGNVEGVNGETKGKKYAATVIKITGPDSVVIERDLESPEVKVQLSFIRGPKVILFKSSVTKMVYSKTDTFTKRWNFCDHDLLANVLKFAKIILTILTRRFRSRV